jgi:hypothetical protein
VTSNGTTISSTATPLSSANGGTATTTALGTAAFAPSSSFPSVATTSPTAWDLLPVAGDDIPYRLSVEATTTLKQVLCSASSTGDTYTFNIYWGATRHATTYAAFSSAQTCTATTTPTSFIPNASTTIPNGSLIHVSIITASSTEADIQLDY